MNSTYWIVGLLVVVVIGGGVYFAMQSPNDMQMGDATMSGEEDVMSEEGTMNEDDTMMEDDMMEKDDTTMDLSDDMIDEAGTYEAYAPEKLARAESSDVVLFFRASWCPTCRALDADINANRSSIPSGLSILDVDYDSSTTLKQKYGVTYQHTLVQVDAEGTMIAKWTGSPTLDALVAMVK